MDRGAWRATVCAIAKSRTRLSTQHTYNVPGCVQTTHCFPLKFHPRLQCRYHPAFPPGSLTALFRGVSSSLGTNSPASTCPCTWDPRARNRDSGCVMCTQLPKIPWGRPHCPSRSESVRLISPCQSPSLPPGLWVCVWGGEGRGHRTQNGSPGWQWEGGQSGVRQPLAPAAKFPMCYLGSPAKGNVTFT